MRRASLPLVAAAAFLGGHLLASSSPHAAAESPDAAADVEAPVQPAGGGSAEAAGDDFPAPAKADVYYPGCDSVRAAGRAPLYAGQPGYSVDMDGDGDGVACEPHRGRGP